MENLTAKQKEIFEIADAIYAETNVHPSVRTVREKMGGGSNSTINGAMKLWRAQNEAQAVVTNEVPQGVNDALLGASGAIWRAASDIAERSIEDERQKCKAEVEVIAGEMDELAEDLDQITSDLDEATKKIKALEADLKRERTANTKQGKELAGLQKLQGRFEQLEADHKALLAKLEQPKVKAVEKA